MTRALLPDLAPWKASADFRRLWTSGLISNFGSFLTFVALPVQLKDLTGSAAAVGAIGAVELLPLIVCGLYGGALADALDKRRLIVWTEAGQGLLSAVLLLDALLPHPVVWPLYAVAALSSALVSVQRPALDSLWPRIVAHDDMPAAASLNSLRWTVGGVAGPAVAGVVVAYAGLGWAYAADLLTFAVSLAYIVRIAPSPASHEASKPSLGAVLEGARYAWSRKELLGTYVVDLAAMFLAMPLAILPFLADELHAGWALGLMYATVPAGAMLVSLTGGWTSRVHRHGLMVLLSATGWGLAVAAAGVCGNVWLVLVFLTVGGGFDMVSGIFRAAMWNQTIPDELRGRLAGIELLSYSVGPQLGQVRAGGLAAWAGVRASVVAGGLACAGAMGLLALCLPGLMTYDARTNEHAVRMRERRAAVRA
ncbi:MFS transporter [Streptomyces filipinensis]|uniref:MFS transporter n=1 Tax=Streptomyces filipinensis TaxID=66887 RepID=A0A918M8J6_9ACTN|nr:MFS transporter [Streptomyces filipinensis]GGU77906.1 MFS transporter [Streptomyces filipinensis]